MILRKLYEFIFAPYPSVRSAQQQTRAEILTWLAVIRQFVVTGVFLFLYSRGAQHIEGLYFAIPLNLICYFFARSRYYKLAALAMIAEPIVIICISVTTSLANAPDLNSVEPITQSILAPIWLAMGGIIACLVLPLRWALGVFAATTIAFAFIYLNIDPFYHKMILMELCFTWFISSLAFIGAVLRERAAHALEIERAKVVQSSKLASLGEMASGVAHELNTPLNAIILNVEMVQELVSDPSTSPEEVKKFMVEIDEIATRMARIISGMKDFSRDTGAAKHEVISSRKWIDDALRLCQSRFKSAKVHLDVKSDANFDRKLQVQPTQLAQVLLNLLNNAFDAVSTSEEKWVRVRANVTEDFFELSVEDSGPGVPPDVAERIFEPFFTTKEIGQGTGLGLSISKGIARKHRGDLVLDRKGRHTRFVIRIPTHIEEDLELSDAA